MGEHAWQESTPPITLNPGPGQDVDEDWSLECHTKASPTNAYGTVDFQDTATRVCRAKVCGSLYYICVSRTNFKVVVNSHPIL